MQEDAYKLWFSRGGQYKLHTCLSGTRPFLFTDIERAFFLEELFKILIVSFKVCQYLEIKI